MQAGSDIHISPIKLDEYKKVVFFTGAGMSKESGIPTYRGKGGTWEEYNYKDMPVSQHLKKILNMYWIFMNSGGRKL